MYGVGRAHMYRQQHRALQKGGVKNGCALENSGMRKKERVSKIYRTITGKRGVLRT